MRTLIIDIETAALPFDNFDPMQQEYLLHFAKDSEGTEQEKEKLSLWGLTAEVVAIGLWHLEKERGTILYQDPDEQAVEWTDEDGKVRFCPASEKTMLTRFWQGVPAYQRFVTFNGRKFDYPFLLHRSAILGVPTDRMFVQSYLKSRYGGLPHCDLLEQFSFYGAFSRKFNLDFFCKTFGIPSPKSGGMTGKDVPVYFRQGRSKEIARYCVGDLQATAELYRRWRDTIDPTRPAEKADVNHLAE